MPARRGEARRTYATATPARNRTTQENPPLARLDPMHGPWLQALHVTTWADDEITDVDRAWVAEHHGNALLHRVDPRHGLTDADYLELDAWLRARTEPRT